MLPRPQHLVAGGLFLLARPGSFCLAAAVAASCLPSVFRRALFLLRLRLTAEFVCVWLRPVAQAKAARHSSTFRLTHATLAQIWCSCRLNQTTQRDLDSVLEVKSSQ